MKKKKLELRYIFLIILLVIILFLSIFSYTLESGRKLNPVESMIKDTIVTTQNIVFAPFRYIASLIDDFNALRDVKKENEALKNEINKIDLTITENIELKREIKALKEELNIELVLSDYEYLNATVISRNVGFWYNTITIDKGEYNGVKVDMAVINSSGLIGRVVSTTNFTSDIKLITTSDTNSRISVSVGRDGFSLNGLINSYDSKENYFEVEGISNSEEVRIGDYVYTSGLGGVFPSGILIGTVSSIETDEYDLAKILKVKPNINFDDINFVTVLKRKDG